MSLWKRKEEEGGERRKKGEGVSDLITNAND